MKTILGIVVTLPVAVIMFFMLVLFTELEFHTKWLALAVALDVFDWIVAEVT